MKDKRVEKETFGKSIDKLLDFKRFSDVFCEFSHKYKGRFDKFLTFFMPYLCPLLITYHFPFITYFIYNPTFADTLPPCLRATRLF